MTEPAVRDILSAPRMLIFSLPSAAGFALTFPLYAFLPTLYSTELGLGLGLTGAIFAAVRLIDVLFDPVCGYMADRLRIGRQRRRPWLFLAAPLLTVAIAMLFFPGDSASPAYLAIGLLAVTMSYTLYAVPYYAWASELVAGERARAQVMAWLQTAGMAGMIGSLALPAILEANGAGLREQIRFMGLYVLVLVPSAVLVAALATREPPLDVDREQPHGLMSNRLRAAFAVVRVQGVARIMIAMLALGLVVGVFTSLLIIYAGDVLGLGGWSSMALLTMAVTGLVGGLAALAFLRVRAKPEAMIAGAGIGVVGALVLGLAPAGQVAVLFAGSMLVGGALGACIYLTRAITADIAERDREARGETRAGLLFGLLFFCEKLGPALAIGAVYGALQRLGFEPGGTNSGADLIAFRMLFTALLSGLFLATAAAMFRFGQHASRART